MSNFVKELEAIKSTHVVFDDAFLADGAITSVFTGQPINDLDFYFRSWDSFKAAVESAYEDGEWCVALSRRAITFGKRNYQPAFQLMFFDWFATAHDVFRAFDFTCCMAAVDYANSAELIFHERFLADVAKRELIFNHKTPFPIASGMRVRKYLERGYKISADEWLKVLLACRFNDAANWRELQDQIGGHYGEAVKLINADDSTPFTLDNAVKALFEIKQRDQLFIDPMNDIIAPPADAKDALKRIRAIIDGEA